MNRTVPVGVIAERAYAILLEKIFEYRTAKDWSVYDVAEKLGTHHSTYHRRETGNYKMDFPQLIQLSFVLGFKLDEMVAYCLRTAKAEAAATEKKAQSKED